MPYGEMGRKCTDERKWKRCHLKKMDLAYEVELLLVPLPLSDSWPPFTPLSKPISYFSDEVTL